MLDPEESRKGSRRSSRNHHVLRRQRRSRRLQPGRPRANRPAHRASRTSSPSPASRVHRYPLNRPSLRLPARPYLPRRQSPRASPLAWHHRPPQDLSWRPEHPAPARQLRQPGDPRMPVSRSRRSSVRKSWPAAPGAARLRVIRTSPEKSLLTLHLLQAVTDLVLGGGPRRVKAKPVATPDYVQLLQVAPLPAPGAPNERRPRALNW